MKTKTKVTLCIVLFLSILALSFGGWYVFLRPQLTFTEEHPVLERTQTYYTKDYIAETNGEVTIESDRFATEEVGVYSVNYHVEKWIFKKDFSLTYEVKDTIPPVITLQSEVLTHNFGDFFTEEEMRSNVSVNEGSFTLTTDYDPYKAGESTVSIHAADDYGNVSEASYRLLNEDKEAPLLFRSGNWTEYVIGEEFNINKIVSYGDNADPLPVFEYSGEVDTSKVGEYPLHASVTDASGNKTEWDLTIVVREEIPEEEPADYSYPFEEFKADYAGANRRFGIDISTWQGDIDFSKVKAAGCEFVIMRIGYSHQGKLFLDEKFRQNLSGAKAAGLPVGVYLFSYDYLESEMLTALEDVFEELGDTKLELPLIFDWENFGRYQNYEMSFLQLNRMYDVFEEQVEAHGYRCMLYGSRYYLANIWQKTDTRPIWLSQYNSVPTYEGPFEIWQRTDVGVIDGIDGKVDLNILYTN